MITPQLGLQIPNTSGISATLPTMSIHPLFDFVAWSKKITSASRYNHFPMTTATANKVRHIPLICPNTDMEKKITAINPHVQPDSFGSELSIAMADCR